MNRTLLITLVTLLLYLIPAAAGTITYQVDWDTSALAAGLFEEGPGTFYWFGAQVVAGNGARNSSLVRISDVALTGGSANYSPQLIGGASGDFAAGANLRDDEFFNGYLQRIDPPQRIRFRLDLYAFEDSGLFPDSFQFGLYTSVDSGYNPIGTYDPLTFTAFARADLAPTGTTQIEVFDSFASRINDSYYIPGPVITGIATGDVPEPGTMLLIGFGCLAVGLRRRF